MVNNIFTDFLNKNNIEKYSRFYSLGGLSTERFIRTFRYLPQKRDFGRGDAIWIHVLTVLSKQNTNRVHSSTELTPKQASL